jgi:hypothetical protein
MTLGIEHWPLGLDMIATMIGPLIKGFATTFRHMFK